jgi:hypothetical protein
MAEFCFNFEAIVSTVTPETRFPTAAAAGAACAKGFEGAESIAVEK